MHRLALIILSLFQNLILHGAAQAPPESNQTNYAKLELEHKRLLGSRWTLERNKTINVYHSFQIVDMQRVDLEGMSIRVDYHVRQRWEAEGLEWPKSLFLPGDPSDVSIITEDAILRSIWSPGSFIPTSRETKIHGVVNPQSVVSIYRNKTIVWKSRIHTLLACSFTFEWYPLDMQVCDLVFESYKYNSLVVNYTWEPWNPVFSDPIQLYQYDLILPPRIHTGYGLRWSGVNHYPNVRITFKFERKLGNNLIQVFIPTTLIVILSWFSFWLGLDAVPGRIALLITCILTLVTMHGSMKGVIPPVHYVKMMDIWMIFCMAFVFGAMSEFVIVKYLHGKQLQEEKAREERVKSLEKLCAGVNLPPMIRVTSPPKPNQVDSPPAPDFPGNQSHPYVDFYRKQGSSNGIQSGDGQFKGPPSPPADPFMQHYYPAGIPGVPPDVALMIHLQQANKCASPSAGRPVWAKVDRVCRILFPLLFSVFNVVYWSILLIGSTYQHPDTDHERQ